MDFGHLGDLGDLGDLGNLGDPDLWDLTTYNVNPLNLPPLEQSEPSLGPPAPALELTLPPPPQSSPRLTPSTEPKSTIDYKIQGDAGFFMVGEKAEIRVPTNSHSCRQVILNALRTVVPALGALKVNDQVHVDLMIYDFYFEGNTLRMLVLVLETMELFDAFALEQDFLHLLVTCHDFVNVATDVDWSALTYRPGFANYFIKCNRTGCYQSLGKGICAAAVKGHFSPSLQNWLSETTRSFFTAARVHNPPEDYLPFPQRLAGNICATAQFPGLHRAECIHGHCKCHRIRKEYEAGANKKRKLPVTELLAYIPSGMSHEAKQFIAPCIRAMKTAMYPPKSQMPPPPPRHPPAATAATAGTELKKCFLGKQCKGSLVCYWTECCKSRHPIVCARHGRVYAKTKLRHKCPLHQRPSKMAMLF